MSDDLLVECPIHLDVVSINDILVFKCGHGFCQPCLEEHFAHGQPSRLSCPSCRQPIKRREAFQLFLTPARASSQTRSSHPTAEAAHVRLTSELREAKAAHANCSDQVLELQHEIDTLRQDGVRSNQTLQHLRDRYDGLQKRQRVEVENSARAKEECNRMKEEMTKLQVEHHKTSMHLADARKDYEAQLERVKQFQGYIDQYKHKYNLEKKKRKAIENAHLQSLPRKEEESLMIVDANAPDTFRQDGPDFGWLDEACIVKGDQLTGPDDEDLEFEKENEYELYDTGGRQGEDQAPAPLQFPSDWNLAMETFSGPSSGVTRKRRHGSRQAGGSRIVKVKMPAASGPLVIDRQGRIKTAVVVGSRQKLNSKN